MISSVAIVTVVALAIAGFIVLVLAWATRDRLKRLTVTVGRVFTATVETLDPPRERPS